MNKIEQTRKELEDRIYRVTKHKEYIKIWKFKDKWRIVKDRKVIWTCDSAFIYHAIEFYKKSAIENTQEESKKEPKEFAYSTLNEPDKKEITLEDVKREQNKLMDDILKK